MRRNANPGEHLECVFEDVVGKMAKPGVKVQVVAIGDGAMELLEYLQAEWERWEGVVDAIVVGTNYVLTTQFEDEKFAEFWGKVGFSLFLFSPSRHGFHVVSINVFALHVYSTQHCTFSWKLT